MTKEELEKEAEEYFKSICGDYNEEYERTGKRHYWVGFDIKNAFIAGAEPREKRIAELEAQIEKMKRCDMCKYSTRLGYCKIRQQGGVCENRNKWELDNLGENEND